MLKKILILPLLDSLPSGHHQVAKALKSYIHRRSTDIQCVKIDLFHQWNPLLERMVSKSYLRWIQHFPQSYAWIYRRVASQSQPSHMYQSLKKIFLCEMKNLVVQESPDLIICTHAFPSYLVSHLKERGECPVPVLNVYTDFFMNSVWGRKMVDYHFVSTVQMKDQLVQESGIEKEKIFVTGIPTDECFWHPSPQKEPKKAYNILLSGGSSGLGKMKLLLKRVRDDGRLNLYVMCGTNQKLYQTISKLKSKNVHPLPYISSRIEMNQLYNMADAIITKPGGVTISEAIHKKLPIFIHSFLPGQEEFNWKYLKQQRIIFTIDEQREINEQILDVLNNKPLMMEYQELLDRLMTDHDFYHPDDIFHFIQSLIYA